VNDADYEVQRTRVRAVFDRWIPLLRLQGWRFMFEWERGGGPEGAAASECVMECYADWRYLHVKFVAYLGTIAEEEDGILEEHVVHELCHVHLHELRENDDAHNDHEERVATQLARAFLEVRNASNAPTLTDLGPVPDPLIVANGVAV
jgi:hypothetical protein